MEFPVPIYVSLFLLTGWTAQWLSWRAGVPAIVLLSAIGVVAGPVLGWLDPDAVLGASYLPLVELSMAVILFEGGLHLRKQELGALRPALTRLVAIGIPLTWALAATAAYFLLGFSWGIAFLAGAVLVVTGPTVILPVLRQSRLEKGVASVLKWEGVINDPVGAVLAVLVFEIVFVAQAGVGVVAASVAAGIGTAVAGGVLGGRALSRAFFRQRVPEYLKMPAILTGLFVLFGVCNSIQHGTGLIAATVFGISLGRKRYPILTDVRRFVEGVTVILIAVLFLLLSADFEPGSLAGIGWGAVGAFVAVLVVLVRPLVAAVCTDGAGLSRRQRRFIGGFAPRGVVAIALGALFAPDLRAVGVVEAGVLQPVLFATVVSTVVLYGLGTVPLARRLGLRTAGSNRILLVGAYPWAFELARALRDVGVGTVIADAAPERIEEARAGGFDVYFGEVLSDRAEDFLNMDSVGYVLAATDNDSYNALVCRRLSDSFGMENVFQLPVHARSMVETHRIGASVQGQPVFAESAVWEALQGMADQSWHVETTRISGRKRGRYAVLAEPGFIPLMAVHPKGGIRFKKAYEELALAEGDTLISYVRPLTERSEAG